MTINEAKPQHLSADKTGAAGEQQSQVGTPPSDMMPSTNTTATVPRIMAVINAAKSLSIP